MSKNLSITPITFRPRTGQFVINELPMLLLTLGLLCAGGSDIVPYRQIFIFLSLLLSLFEAYKYAYLRSKTFTIGEEMLVYEHGVLVRTRDYVELYRVIDYRERRTAMQQLFGLKTVTIISGDRSTPWLDVEGIDEKTDMVMFIRKLVEINKRRKGIYEITNR